MSKQVFKYYLENHHLDWECVFCSFPKFSDSFFDQTGNEPAIEADSTQEPCTNATASLDNASTRDDAEIYLQQAALHLNSSTKDLKIAHLNICSIRNKIDKLRVLQSICGFDIIAITETHLDGSISDNLLHIDGMKLFRRDRTKCKGGGCIMYCAEYLPTIHRRDLASSDLEAIWVQIKFPTTSALISVVYRSELESPNFFDDIYSVFEKAWMKSDTIILLGDFNCDFQDIESKTGSEIQPKTKRLLTLFQLFGMQNIVNMPTRITLESSTLIDLIVTTKPDLINRKGVLPLGISDHCLTYATLNLKLKRPPPKVINVRNYKRFQADKFQADITAAPFHVARVFNDKDDVLWAWNTLFKEICDSHAPTKRVKIRSQSSPWINNDIRRKMNLRFKLFKRAVSTKNQEIYARYKKVRNEITCEIRNAKARYFTDKIAEVKSTAAYWNLITEATNPVRRNRIGPLRREDGSLVVNDIEKANLINDFFANIGTRLGRANSNLLKQTDRTGFSVPSESDIIVREDSVQRKLKAIKPNKSSGPDEIPPKLLKLAEPAIVSPLTDLFSFCAHLGETFTEWKKARLIPVYKKDDEANMNNYRPISLLSVPSKIMESCVSEIVARHVSQNELVTDKQWAYREGHSTDLLLVHLSEIWRTAIDENKVVAVAFVDFKKAFDCVSHPILIHKLRSQFGIQGTLLSWLTDYLTDRTQFSVVNGQHSSVLNVTCGIPQGSVLGPTLFALYTNDLPSAVTSGSVFMYADDTTVYCIGDTVDNAVTSLNKALSELNSWCLENSLTPHSAKCEAMLLVRKPHIGPLSSVTIGEDRIEWVKHTRLLGVTIDNKLSWVRHLTNVRKNFVNKLNLLKRSSFLRRNALLDLYFKIILPSVLYGLVVWGACPNADLLNSLEILHRRAARIIYNLPRDLPSEEVYRHSNWKTLTFYYKLRIIKLIHSVFNGEAPAALSYLTNKPRNPYNLRKSNNITVPRFSTYFLKNSIRYRGAVLWNAVSNHYTGHFSDFYRKVKKDLYFKELDFNALSIQSLPRHFQDFKCF